MKRAITTITLAREIASGEIVHIDAAKNGLRCNCICIDCNGQLEAVQGKLKKRAWHFRHHVDKNCSGGQETALHLAAKEIIKSNFKIIIEADNIFEYHTASIEEKMDIHIVDAIVRNLNELLAIEILVTHPIGMDKEEYFIKNKIKAIEIDLRQIDRRINLEDLERLIINTFKNKRLIYPNRIKENNFKSVDQSDNSWVLFLFVGVMAYFGLKYHRSKRKKGNFQGRSHNHRINRNLNQVYFKQR
jgi:hypothetical protein